MKDFLKNNINNKSLREFAITLNHFCIIEILVVGFFSYMAYDLLQWYKGLMTVESFNGTAFWGAIASLVAAIFSALKYINTAYNDRNKQ